MGFCPNLGNANTVKSQFEAVSIKQSTIALFCSLAISTLFLYTSEAYSAEHDIQLKSEETGDDGFGNKLLAYKMVEHKVDGADITDRYSAEATIPGPTLFLTEGDVVHISILNAIPGNETPVPGISKQVSIHVHGVHYDILSDGTLKVINHNFDEGAGAGLEETYAVYNYKWNLHMELPAHGLTMITIMKVIMVQKIKGYSVQLL